MGSTDMGNITQVMPGIHPIVGMDAGGAFDAPAGVRGGGGQSQRRHGGRRRRRSCWRAPWFGLRRRPPNGTGCSSWPNGGRQAHRRIAHDADGAESWLAGNYDDLVDWRRHIHRHPELGRQEFATTKFVAEKLADAGLKPEVLPGGTGLICDIGPEHRPRIALRADMDALPMSERTGAPYSSTVPGVAHACGHDGHTAILLGTALALASVPELPVGVPSGPIVMPVGRERPLATTVDIAGWAYL